MSEPAGTVRLELPIFEGPLDLLLYLVRRHELSILEIPIGFVTEKYLEYLALMQELDIDIASEYLVMAATLAYLKSRELLPQPEAPPPDPTAEEADPRGELIRRLLEYQRYKDAADRLAERPILGRDTFVRPTAAAETEAAAPDAPLAELPVFALLEAFNGILKKAKVHVSHEVVVDRITLAQRIHELVERLERDTTVEFASCFDLEAGEAQLRHQIVITFLAILEMAKLGMLRIHQSAPGTSIHLVRARSAAERPAAFEDYR